MSTDEYLKYMIHHVLTKKEQEDEVVGKTIGESHSLEYSNKWFGTIPFLFKYLFYREKKA